MEIGDKEGEPFVTEPVSDPFQKPSDVPVEQPDPVEVPAVKEPLVPA